MPFGEELAYFRRRFCILHKSMRALNLKECCSRHRGARLPNKDRSSSAGLNTLLAFKAGEGMTDLCRGQEAFITALTSSTKSGRANSTCRSTLTWRRG